MLAHKQRRTNEKMDLQVKVHNQRVEKLFFSTLSFDPPKKESLVYELKLRIPKLNKMTTQMILEYLDDEGDYIHTYIHTYIQLYLF